MNCKSKSIIITIVVIAVLALALSVQAGSLTVVKQSTPAQQAAAAAYWTPQRISQATAMELELMPDMESAVFDSVAMEEAADIGPAGSTPSGMPAPDADQVARLEYWQDWEALETAAAEEALEMDQTAESEGTAGVYISYDVNYYSQMWKTYPYRTIGRLSFKSGTTTYYCTATVISPNNIIVTAAHCVYNTDTNQWYNSFVFTPAYRNGSAPYGTFPYVSARVLTAWINAPSTSAGFRYDVAVIKLGNNSAGHPVTYYTGYAGRSWNYPYNILNFNAGYALPGYLRACMNESFQYATDVAGGGCNLTSGMAGGPWFKTYAPYTSGAYNYVNDVDIAYSATSSNIYGARFSSSNIVPLCTAEGC